MKYLLMIYGSETAEEKMSEAEMIAVLKASQIKEARDATSLAEIPDAVLRMAIEDWAGVEQTAERLRAKAA